MVRRLLIVFVAILTTLTAVAQDMSNSIEYSQLYIVGAATPVGWSDTNAIEMAKISDGVFKWQGRLIADEDFKFLNTRSWYKNILSASPDVVVVPSATYDLDFYAAWDLKGRDWKFRVSESGNYCVLVDLMHMKMTVTKASDNPTCPSRLYITGTAVDGKVMELRNMYNVEFKKTVYCTPGNLLLVDTPEINENTVYYGPVYDDVDLTFGKGFLSQLTIVDKSSHGWSVATKGDYTIYVDKNNFTHQGRKFVMRNVLYIVGGCCELNWNYWDESNKRFFPNPDNRAELIWEGPLRIGSQEEPDKFKILTAESWTSDTYHPYIADVLAEGETETRISGGDDLKWTIERDGIYRLTLNTLTETLKSEYLGPLDTELAAPGESASSRVDAITSSDSIRISDSQIYVDCSCASNVVVRNLSGMTISAITDHISGPVTGHLPNGIYLLTVNSRTAKIFVR